MPEIAANSRHSDEHNISQASLAIDLLRQMIAENLEPDTFATFGVTVEVKNGFIGLVRTSHEESFK